MTLTNAGKMKYLLTISIALLFSTSLIGQISINGKSCQGTWKTVDDESGRTKSHVKIYEKGGKFYGEIVKLLDPESLKESGVDTFEEIICDKCPEGKGKGKPVLGLKIIWNMEKQSDRWASGEIMDPKNGKVYGCSMWLDEEDKKGNTLKVRGWLAFFYRTQTWYRVE